MLPDDNQQTRRQDPNSPQGGGSSPPISPPDDIYQSGSFQKEKELARKQDEKYIEEIGKELELEKEVEEGGMEKVGGEIILPNEVKNQGVELTEPVVPIVPKAQASVTLSKEQIKKAFHKKVTDSILWWAVWCLRQLKIKNSKNSKEE